MAVNAGAPGTPPSNLPGTVPGTVPGTAAGAAEAGTVTAQDRTAVQAGIGARLAAVIWRPSRRSMRSLALAGVIANAGIIVTGAAVRLSQSGLGCPDWPLCTSRSLVVARSPGQTLANTWIEFGNRLLTFAVMAVAVAVCAAAWHFRPVGRDGLARRRAGLVWLAIAQPAGVVLQAVLGGITVLTKLNPAMVAVHFLVSMAIVAVTVVFYVRCAEDDVPAAALVRADLRLLTGAVLAAAGLMFAAGTVVTGAGPLAGNANAHRFQLPLGAVTQVHADIGWLLGGLAITLAAGLALSDAPPRAVRLGWLLLGMLAVQGAVGYTQYFTGLPPILVGLHVLGSVLVWIIAVRLLLALRDRGSVTTTPAAAGGPHT